MFSMGVILDEALPVFTLFNIIFLELLRVWLLLLKSQLYVGLQHIHWNVAIEVFYDLSMLFVSCIK